jgi:rubrerythrin
MKSWPLPSGLKKKLLISTPGLMIEYLDEKASVFDLFKIALEAEKESEDFYNRAQQRAEDKAPKKILEYLSRVERSHYFVIKSEIDLLEFFPDYYNVEEFHFGHEMVHVGP